MATSEVVCVSVCAHSLRALVVIDLCFFGDRKFACVNRKQMGEMRWSGGGGGRREEEVRDSTTLSRKNLIK